MTGWETKYLNKVVNIDCREGVKELPDGCVSCIITSPPYWGLRDYGLPPMIWDAVDGCQHQWGDEFLGDTRECNIGGNAPRWAHEPHPGGKIPKHVKVSQGQFCSLCGAWRGSLGLEPTFQLYIQHLMQIFNEIKRVLKPTGCCFVNIGDTYYGGGNNRGNNSPISEKQASNRGAVGQVQMKWRKETKPKSLYQIPSRFAIAMTDAGWILRNEIIWKKANCMPSSARDRFTVDFEKVFFFTKNKKYWFEQQFEERQGKTHSRGTKRKPPIESAGVGHKDWCKYMTKDDELKNRNKRCVWDIPTQPFKEAHFATFSLALVKPMLSAGCPEFVCRKCGKAREKIYKSTITKDYTDFKRQIPEEQSVDGYRNTSDKETIPKKFIGLTDCGCNANFDGGIVLDPFAGSGTVGVVAMRQNKNFIGFDLNPDYVDMGNERIGQAKKEMELKRQQLKLEL